MNPTLSSRGYQKATLSFSLQQEGVFNHGLPCSFGKQTMHTPNGCLEHPAGHAYTMEYASPSFTHKKFNALI